MQNRPVQMPPEITKDQAKAFPIAKYRGHIHLIQNPDDAKRAVERLEKEKVLGFDMEKRPTFRAGQKSHPPALVQLASRRAAYIFQLRHCGFCRPLRRLLANPKIIKAGVAVDRDVLELNTLARFRPGGFVDVGELARQTGSDKTGLRALAIRLLGLRVSKSCQTSNWANEILSPAQIQYAATDAWLGRELYHKLQSLAS